MALLLKGFFLSCNALSVTGLLAGAYTGFDVANHISTNNRALNDSTESALLVEKVCINTCLIPTCALTGAFLGYTWIVSVPLIYSRVRNIKKD